MDISDPHPGGPINLLVRGRQLAKQLTCSPPPAVVDASVACAPIDTLAEYSKDGRLLACVEESGVRVLEASGGREVFSTPRPQVQAISMSPLGTFLLTWERISEGMGLDNGNLRIWRVATGELVCHWLQKALGEKSLWPGIAWSCDEELAYRLVTNEVHFFDGRSPTQQAQH